MMNVSELQLPENLGDPIGVLMLYGQEDKRGLVRGWMQYGEHAGDVDVDVSRLEVDHAVLRSRKTTSYVFTAPFYEATQQLVDHLLATQPDFTRRALLALLGEAGTDRYIEHLGLGGPEPEVTELEKVVPNAGAKPSKR